MRQLDRTDFSADTAADGTSQPARHKAGARPEDRARSCIPVKAGVHRPTSGQNFGCHLVESGTRSGAGGRSRDREAARAGTGSPCQGLRGEREVKGPSGGSYVISPVYVRCGLPRSACGAGGETEEE